MCWGGYACECSALGQKWESQPPELELVAVVRSLVRVLGKEPKSSERAFVWQFPRRYTKHICSAQIGGYNSQNADTPQTNLVTSEFCWGCLQEHGWGATYSFSSKASSSTGDISQNVGTWSTLHSWQAAQRVETGFSKLTPSSWASQRQLIGFCFFRVAGLPQCLFAALSLLW